MTDNERPEDRGRDHATGDRSSHAQRGWTGFLAHRWPTALGVAVAALTVFDLRIDAGSISFLSALVVLMPLVYVGAAVVDRRRFAWVVLVAAVTPLVLTKVLDLQMNLHPAFLLAALVFLALGAARGRLRGSDGVPLQAAGMLVFGAAMLVALYVEPEIGGMIVAVGLLGHAAWDAVHYVGNRVVTRPYAEFCAVVDLLAAAATLFRWWAGRLGDRLGAASLLVPAVAASALGVLAPVFAASPAVVLIGMAVFRAGWGVSQNATLALMLDRVAPSGYGAASALWYAAYDAGIGLGAFGFGVVAAATGYPAAYALTAALILAAIFPARQDPETDRKR